MEFQSNGQAIYLQIADYICEKILLHIWNAEDKIPSVRELAIELAVNPNTVARTYDFLKQQNIIYDKRGIGYFVAEQGYEQAIAYKTKVFEENDLPQIFRTMYLIGLSPNEVAKQYKKFVQENFN